MGQAEKYMALPNHLSNLTSFLLLKLELLLIHISCIRSLDISMKLTPTTNPCSQIYHWKRTGLLIAVGFGYILRLIW